MFGNIWSTLGLLLLVLITFEVSDAAKIKCKDKAENKKSIVASGAADNATEGSLRGVLDSFQQCSCGWRNSVGARIMGGTEAGVNEFPMMAALVDTQRGYAFCGATIISNKHVLSAAHCFVGDLLPPANFLGILVGDHNLKTGAETSAARLHKVARTDLHPSYDSSKTSENDIAVVTIDGAIDFSNEVGPVCLPFRHRNDDFEGLSLDVIGWGAMEFGQGPSDVLMKTSLAVVNLSVCKKAYPKANNLNYRHLCTFTAGRDACQFDSGGPVLWQNPGSGRLVLLGITSTGVFCDGQTASINTRVGPYMDWITSVTPGAQYCQAE